MAGLRFLIGVKIMLTENIDADINGYSSEMVDGLGNENLAEIEKALGVLTNDGVYGYYVYCKSKAKGKERVRDTIFKMFVAGVVNRFNPVVNNRYEIKSQMAGIGDYDRYFKTLSKDIHKLLFFRDILEQILIYARYHAKAKKQDGA